jgi:pyrimidine-nucleoside phosphorylase
VIGAKRDRRMVDPDDLRRFVLGFARGEIADYQAAAFLMAAYLNGLSTAETAEMTRAMVESGITLPLSGVSRRKVDKHSTGGVSDGVTLVFAPLAASVGLAVAKLSGRGLGHTGGTLDKLESIPGLTTRLDPDRLERQVEDVGCAVAGQTSDLVPADGALYALRDATATVPSIPLIAASVMSKKLAVGTDLILLDVKAGSGAFMKTPEEAMSLATACVDLASAWDRPARAAVTDMSQPLGRAIGNALDVAEAVATLRGEDGGRVRTLSVLFAGAALEQMGLVESGQGAVRAEAALDSGVAAETFGRMIAAQGGAASVIDDPWGVLPKAPTMIDVTAREGGWLVAVDAEALGRAAVTLGAGRIRKEDLIDPAVGIEFLVDIGQHLERGGAVVARIHARTPEAADRAADEVLAALTVSEDGPVEPPHLVHAWVPDTSEATA